MLLKANEKEIIFTVKDNGVGISPEDMKKLFTPFYRGDNGNSFVGNGIGLYMAQMIIRLFNGQIEIASAPNEGTTVSVLFSPLG